MFSTDPLDQFLARQPADVTATPAPKAPVQQTIGPAAPPSPRPVGGLLGGLFSIGNTIDTGIRSRMQTGPTKGDALNAVLLALPELRALAPAVSESKSLPLAYEGTASLFPALMEKHAAGGTADEALASLRTALPNSPAPGLRTVADSAIAHVVGTIAHAPDVSFSEATGAARAELSAAREKYQHTMLYGHPSEFEDANAEYEQARKAYDQARVAAQADFRAAVGRQHKGPLSIADSAATHALRNIMETGFAGGKNAAMVELPVSGAGRSGSTATAMKAALTKTTPADFRTMVQREIARRGGATSPEVEMAATEEVARKLASARP